MHEDDLAFLAKTLVDLRKSRKEILPAALLGGEQGWDFLLALFVADTSGARLTGRQLLEAEGGLESTGRRWIKVLTTLDLIVGDGAGRLDDPLSLTPAGLGALEQWLGQLRSRLSRSYIITQDC